MSVVYGSKRIKSALGFFLAGKVLSGGLGIFVLVWLVRMLSAADYGVYVSLAAFQTVALMVSSFGIESTVERFLPEVRVKQGKAKAFSLIVYGGLARLITLFFAASLIYYFSEFIVGYLKLSQLQGVVRLFAVSFMFNGLVAALLVFLDALLMQKWSQFVAICFALIKVACLWVSVEDAHLKLQDVFIADICASIIGGGVALFSLYKWQSHGVVLSDSHGKESDLGARMTRFATFNYFAQLLIAAYSQDTIKLIIARSINVLASARYGFVTNIVDLVQRYLPAMLLIRLIRPVFVSRYAVSKDFQQLNLMASVVLKINIMFLLPAIVYTFIYGRQLVGLLSHGKYPDTHFLLAVILLALVPATHQWVLSIVASTIERNELQLKSALIAVLMLPVAIFVIPAYGLYGAVLATYLSSIFYNTYATYYLRKMGYAYSQDWRGLLRAVICAAVTGGGAWWSACFVSGWFDLAVAALCIFGVFLALAVWLKPFSSYERELINKILPKPIFFF